MSKHFDKSTDKKITCSCCGTGDLVPEVYAVLELVRAYFNRPVTINSGYRCLKYNRSIGSNDRSQHPKGTAVDIRVKDIEPVEVYEFLDETFPNTYGIGLYVDMNFVHTDVREVKARW